LDIDRRKSADPPSILISRKESKKLFRVEIGDPLQGYHILSLDLLATEIIYGTWVPKLRTHVGKVYTADDADPLLGGTGRRLQCVQELRNRRICFRKLSIIEIVIKRPTEDRNDFGFHVRAEDRLEKNHLELDRVFRPMEEFILKQRLGALLRKGFHEISIGSYDPKWRFEVFESETETAL
jgi:hypothetical protein